MFEHRLTIRSSAKKRPRVSFLDPEPSDSSSPAEQSPTRVTRADKRPPNYSPIAVPLRDSAELKSKKRAEIADIRVEQLEKRIVCLEDELGLRADTAEIRMELERLEKAAWETGLLCIKYMITTRKA